MFFDYYDDGTLGADPCEWWGNCSPGGGGSTGGGWGNSSGGGSSNPWWQSVLNQGVALTSQIIGAYGNNPTQQIGWGVNAYGGGYSPQAINMSQAQLQQAIANQNAANYAAQQGGANGIGSSVGGGLDGMINWATRNPVPVFLGIAGLFLLMREPPRSRR